MHCLRCQTRHPATNKPAWNSDPFSTFHWSKGKNISPKSERTTIQPAKDKAKMLNIKHEVLEKRSIRILAVPPISPTLLGLPAELQLHIISHLDYPSSLALSQTNRQLRCIVPVQSPRTSAQKMAFLNAVETWQKYFKFQRTRTLTTSTLTSCVPSH
jgi:hypothetical protein